MVALVFIVMVAGYLTIGSLVSGYLDTKMGRHKYMTDAYVLLAIFGPIALFWFCILRFPAAIGSRIGSAIATKQLQRQKNALETRKRIAIDINQLHIETKQLEEEAAREVEECLNNRRVL